MLGLHLAVCLAAVLASTAQGPETYDPSWSSRLEGYGQTWMYFPDGRGVPRVALLASDERSTPSIPSEVGPDDVSFYLYTRRQELSEIIDVDDPNSLWQSSFDPKRPTRIVTHGWRSSSDADVVQIIKSAYLEMEDCNVIGVDWSPLASSKFYPWAKSYTNPVGRRVSELVKMMVGEEKWGADGDRRRKKKKAVGTDKGRAKLKDIHLLGHSLGAHLMGYAGQHLRPHKVSRITGMDPAMPLFEILPSSDGHLDSSDAEFVDVIHTCAGALGFLDNIGHADFYPNGGTPVQPGCCCAAEFAEACSHGRSYQFFAESIRSKDFVGLACDSWEGFQNGSCAGGPTAVMGEHTSPGTRGVFYLNTMRSAPFALGERGARSASSAFHDDYDY
ncbi:pancreatic lipase-related protein 2-like [Frankliniella occidentalis]|uniref:Pancreatic lipase-related protein 2-like n=1 Tax=Frankliniella occidentalis TaxID=133901 RepID=A0A6J1SHT4_FRAOC|nr:pancreatic lipase-related protein 2-like [Frankliniella occidentalis]